MSYFGTKPCFYIVTDTNNGYRQIPKHKIGLMFHIEPLSPSLERSDSSPCTLSDPQQRPNNHSDPVQAKFPQPSKWQKATGQEVLSVSDVPSPQQGQSCFQPHLDILPPQLCLAYKVQTKQDPKQHSSSAKSMCAWQGGTKQR